MYDTLQPTTELPLSQFTTNMSPSALAASPPGQEVAISLGPDAAGTPQPAPVPQVYVFVKETVPCGGTGDDDPEFMFDVILNVSSSQTGESSTIIKKIKFCKYQLAQELADSLKHKPATMVEELKGDNVESVEQIRKRLRTLCNY